MAKPNGTVSLTTDGRLFGGWPAYEAARIADLDATAATNHLAGLWSVSGTVLGRRASPRRLRRLRWLRRGDGLARRFVLWWQKDDSCFKRLWAYLVTGAKVWASRCLVLRTPTIK